MRSWIKYLMPVILFFSMVPVFNGCGGSQPDITILSVSEGSVQIQKYGTDDWSQPSAGIELQAGDVIKTGSGGSVTVTFFDGSVIELEPDTQVEIVELVKGEAKIIRLKQEIGETLSKVEKLADPAALYEIETPAAVAGVRGSQMRIKVAEDGTTSVESLEGKIYVKAQSVEYDIPVGSVSTVVPGQAPSEPEPAQGSMTTATTTGPEVQGMIAWDPGNIATDPQGDLFDVQGNPVTGDGYLDILESALEKHGDNWVLTVKLDGDIPLNSGDDYNIEWDLMIDSDNDSETGWKTAVYTNDLGVDYYLNIFLNGEYMRANAIKAATSSSIADSGMTYKIDGAIAQLVFPAELIGDPDEFGYVVLTRKYDKTDGTLHQMIGADKMPDGGHYNAIR